MLADSSHSGSYFLAFASLLLLRQKLLHDVQQREKCFEQKDKRFRPNELMAMMQMKLLKLYSNRNLTEKLNYTVLLKKSIEFCEAKLEQVSRSFALVITFLPNRKDCPLKLGTAVFYLVLRALDTIEDEMVLSKFEKFVIPADKGHKQQANLMAKRRLLSTFFQRFLSTSTDVSITGIGVGHEEELLGNLELLKDIFQLIPSDMQHVILDIAKEMGEGMCEYISRDLHDGTEDEIDFSNYCYIVAGTVGKGLTELFALYSPSKSKMRALPNKRALWQSMGEFLQRTNIIRDFNEDSIEGRAFWPKTVWHKHLPPSEKARLEVFTRKDMIENGNSVNCLNDMIINALHLYKDIMQYMLFIEDPSIYAFCVIPQLMALGTLTACYCNSNVFKGVVKMRKGESASIVIDFVPSTRISSIEDLNKRFILWTTFYLNRFRAKATMDETDRLLKERMLEKLEMLQGVLDSSF